MGLSDLASPIVVIGAGAAGIACSLAAAARNANVILVEQTSKPGGTVSQALIHTIAGLFDDGGAVLNNGLPAELLERLAQASPQTKKRRIGKAWVLDVDPAIYTEVVTSWIAATSAITAAFHATISNIVVDSGSIKLIDISHSGQSFTVAPRAVVDTTGHAAFIRRINPGSVADGMALGGVVLQLRGVEEGVLQFPKNVALLREIRKAVEQHQLPRECATVWLDSGIYSDEIYAKFNITVDTYQHERMQMVAKKLLAFLHTLPGFSGISISATGDLGIRDGGRIRGEYCLTAEDVTSGRQFDDAICQASWPIEHWHLEKGIMLEYLPVGQSYSIPLRSLKVSGFNNLWAAGKCLSAEPRAQASARVVGTCWAMGEAVGKHIAGAATCH